MLCGGEGIPLRDPPLALTASHGWLLALPPDLKPCREESRERAYE